MPDSRITTVDVLSLSSVMPPAPSVPFSPRKPFDFTAAVEAVCRDMCGRLDAFGHIDLDRVAICFAQTRSRATHGIQAKLTPLRFEHGGLFSNRNGETWTLQRVFLAQREMLYLLTFYLPRFLDQSFEEKLITILHELYHISPKFNGDIRRFQGRCHAHSNSQKEYDRWMAEFAKQYLAMRPAAKLLRFLKNDFRTLKERHGQVIGLQVPIPRLIRTAARAA